MNVPTRQEVMESSSVHNLTKDILRLSANKDCVDVVHDTELALAVLKAEMDAVLRRGVSQGKCQRPDNGCNHLEFGIGIR